MLELNLGFESNIQSIVIAKLRSIAILIMNLKHAYSDVSFVILSMSTMGIVSKSSESLHFMLDELNIDRSAQNYIISKVMNT